MSCRTAGNITTPEKLWKFLMDKKNALGDIPKRLWEAWYRRDVRNAQEMDRAINKGYFIENLEHFDASFAGISPREAEQMDPDKRLLELAWEALENARIDPKTLSKSDTSVIKGVDSDDYSRLLLEDLPNVEAWMGIRTQPHGVANRIFHQLDLMGPSSAVGRRSLCILIGCDSPRQTSHRAWGVPGSHCRWRACLLLSGTVPES